MKSTLILLFLCGVIAATSAAVCHNKEGCVPPRGLVSSVADGIRGFMDAFRGKDSNKQPLPPLSVQEKTFAPYVFEPTKAPVTTTTIKTTVKVVPNINPTPASTTSTLMPTNAPTAAPLPYDIEDVCIVKKCYDQPDFKSEVCGTNKKTYRNLKILKCVKIQCNPKTDFLKWGSCDAVTTTTTPEPDEPIILLPEKSVKPKNEEGTVVDYECWKKCPRLAAYAPVCGSDNVDYDNESFLSCTNQCGKRVTFVRNGKC